MRIATVTETDVIDAMNLLQDLATPAANFGPDGVTVTTVHGDAWSCHLATRVSTASSRNAYGRRQDLASLP